MKVLDRKLLRELRASWGLLFATTSLIAVGVMCFIYMRTAHRNLRLAQAQYYAEGRLADFWIDLKKLPLSELDLLADIKGISELRPRIQFFATVDLPRVREPINGQVLSVPDRRQPMINDLVLKRGSYFTDSRRNEVIVNDAFAREHKLYPGEIINLILNNQRQELFIVGTAISPEFVYLVGPGSLTPDPHHFGVFYLKQSFAEEVFDMEGAANQVLGMVSPELRENPEPILQQAERILSSYGVFNTLARKDQPSSRYLSDEIRGLGVFASIMPTIFLVVAALVLNILMSRLVDQQQTIIGTLKGLGYADSQIFMHYVKFAGTIGILGAAVGCAAGYGMSEFVTRLYRTFFEFPELANRFEPTIYLLGIAISLACSLGGAVHGARLALKLRPAEAMHVKPPAQGKTVWLEKITFLWQRLSFGWRMVFRNLIRNRLRTAVCLFAAAMGAGLMTTGFILYNATGYLIEFQFELIQRSDLDLSLEKERSIDVLEEARRLPGVNYAEPTLDVACDFSHGQYHRKGGITGLVQNPKLTVPRNSAAQPVRVPTSGVAMTRKMAEILHLEEGDSFTATPIKGLRQPITLTVAEIADSYLGLGVHTDITYLSHLIGEETAVTGVQLKVNSANAEKFELYRQLKQMPALQAVNSRQDMLQNLKETLVNMQRIFIGLITLFAGVIFFSSLLNTSLIGLAERKREVATLRVLGYGPFEIGGLFLRESMVVNALGTTLGLPLGYGLCQWIAHIYNTDMFRFPVVTPPIVFILTFGLAALFGMMSHAVVQREIWKFKWLDALQVKE